MPRRPHRPRVVMLFPQFFLRLASPVATPPPTPLHFPRLCILSSPYALRDPLRVPTRRRQRLPLGHKRPPAVLPRRCHPRRRCRQRIPHLLHCATRRRSSSSSASSGRSPFFPLKSSAARLMPQMPAWEMLSTYENIKQRQKGEVNGFSDSAVDEALSDVRRERNIYTIFTSGFSFENKVLSCSHHASERGYAGTVDEALA